MAALPPASRSAMMPEPTTVATKSAVPSPSAKSRRGSGAGASAHQAAEAGDTAAAAPASFAAPLFLPVPIALSCFCRLEFDRAARSGRLTKIAMRLVSMRSASANARRDFRLVRSGEAPDRGCPNARSSAGPATPGRFPPPRCRRR